MGAVTRAALGAAAVAVMLTLLGGCALVLPGAFTDINAAAAELDVDSAGEVIDEGNRGGGIFFDEPPTRVVLYSDPAAYDVLVERLEDAGYEAGSTTEDRSSWTRGDGENFVGVVVRQVRAGDEVLLSTGDIVNVDEPGTALSIRS